MISYVMSGLPGGQECVDASLALGQVFHHHDGHDDDDYVNYDDD